MPKTTLPSLAAICLLVAAGPLRADMIVGDAGLSGLGSFTGTVEYLPDAGGLSGTLTISLTNTSPAANGGYLTAFAFNNPGGLISGVTLVPGDPDFGLLGEAPFAGGVAAAPFGSFDLGAGTGGSWLGGGSPAPGIGAGDSAEFTFHLTGGGLDTLSASSFLATLSDSPQGGGALAFVARFRGFEDGGSDKVPARPGQPEPEASTVNAPEPGAAALAGLGAAALLGWVAGRPGSRRRA